MNEKAIQKAVKPLVSDRYKIDNIRIKLESVAFMADCVVIDTYNYNRAVDVCAGIQTILSEITPYFHKLDEYISLMEDAFTAEELEQIEKGGAES